MLKKGKNMKKKLIVASVASIMSLSYAATFNVIADREQNNYQIVRIQEGTWTEWQDIGASYDCSVWTPSVDSQDYGTTFTQDRSCSQNQERTKDVQKNTDGVTTISTIKEEQTITRSESQSATGTKIVRNLCVDILNRGESTGNGVYTVDLDGEGTAHTARSAYCDMNGGGWTLYDSFGSKLVMTGGANPAAYNYSNINSTSALSSAGYNYYLNAINSTYDNYYVSPFYMQFFYGSTPYGYIQKTIPSWALGVRVYQAHNWYGGTNWVSYGSTTYSIPEWAGGSFKTFSGGGKTLTMKENGIFWIDSVWVK